MERHFTYGDIKQFLLSVYHPLDDETVRITEVQLMTLYGFTRPLWMATHERRWAHHTQKGTSLLTEAVNPDGSPRLSFVLGDTLAYGLSSPAEEDAEIARAKQEAAERMAAEKAVVQP